MLRMRNVLIITCALLSAVVAAPAGATIVRGFSLRAMTVEAHAVVRGEVVDTEVVYDATTRRVYTHSFVEVHESLAGTARPGDVVVVRQLGGVLDGIEQVLVGTAKLGLGAEVLLFARTDGAFHYLIGMAQGAWHVERPAGDAPARLARTLDGGLALIAHESPVAAPVPSNRTTLDSLRAFVASVLAEQVEEAR